MVRFCTTELLEGQELSVLSPNWRAEQAYLIVCIQGFSLGGCCKYLNVHEKFNIVLKFHCRPSLAILLFYLLVELALFVWPVTDFLKLDWCLPLGGAFSCWPCQFFCLNPYIAVALQGRSKQTFLSAQANGSMMKCMKRAQNFEI